MISKGDIFKEVEKIFKESKKMMNSSSMYENINTFNSYYEKYKFKYDHNFWKFIINHKLFISLYIRHKDYYISKYFYDIIYNIFYKKSEGDMKLNESYYKLPYALRYDRRLNEISIENFKEYFCQEI